MRNPYCYILKTFSILVMFVIFVGMTDCGDVRKTSVVGEPVYTALKEGQGSYEAMITDEQSRIEVKEVSFSGTTKIGGILYEQSDAAGVLELDALMGKQIKILDDNYKSIRYPDKALVLAKIIDEKSSPEKRRIPSLPDVDVCGIDRKTGKILFKAELLDGQHVSVSEGAEFAGVDKKTSKTLFDAKVVEVRVPLTGEEDGREILIPRDIVLCGVDKKTGAGMAWFLRKIDIIEFKRQEPKEYPEATIDVKFKEAMVKVNNKK